MPIVSVIVPNYNHAKYLHQRIDSILAQTYQDFELILLDDKSLDSSNEIIMSYQNHPKVSQIILNDINSGSTFKQWDRGISISSGKYVWIAESDDYSDPRFLSTMVSLLEANSSCSLAFAQSKHVNETGAYTDFGIIAVDEVWATSTVLTSSSALKQFIWHTQIVNASAVVFKREAYDSIKSKYYTKFKLCGDWVFWIQLLEYGGLIYERTELNYFRQHANSVRNNSIINNIDVLESLSIYDYFISNHKNIVGKYESKKLEERLGYKLYVNFCMLLNGAKVLNMRKATVESFTRFPNLIPVLAKLFLKRLLHN